MTMETFVVEPSIQDGNSATYTGEQPLLRDSVEMALTNYFKNMDGQPVSELYSMVLQEVEQPLLEAVMRYTKGNQTKAAKVLGLNRGTLRKKLKTYGID
ncbi:MAG: DNA-binding transcriptional regulator Fis [Kangiellaceae bacterium]|jgi:Fis family transcriptional regulator|nr:DNA-binding transcriptional regulator Fis [Kangiellaceae bacterium]|tara:strand:+ start:2650 stop:2946 length:297 start_codon:yes stop_codon:yes gene_type:complete